jgi:hypothetical protein
LAHHAAGHTLCNLADIRMKILRDRHINPYQRIKPVEMNHALAMRARHRLIDLRDNGARDAQDRGREIHGHSLGTTFPAPHPWDAPDPLPVMRREMKLLLIEISKLRVEVERLRAAEQEARYLSASLDQIMESRDQWRREAEHLRALIAQVTPWSLLWWRCLGHLHDVVWHRARAGQS